MKYKNKYRPIFYCSENAYKLLQKAMEEYIKKEYKKFIYFNDEWNRE